MLWRYGELADRVARLAGHLRALGLAPGDRIALLMKNHPSYLEALYAAWWAGLAAVPVNARLHPEEIAYIVDHSEAAAMVVTDDLADSVALLSSRLRAMLVPGTPAYAAAPRHRADRRRAARARRPRLALLHLGNDRAAEGRDADAPQPGDDDRVLLHRRRRCRPCRRDRLRRADVARRRALQPAVRRARARATSFPSRAGSIRPSSSRLRATSAGSACSRRRRWCTASSSTSPPAARRATASRPSSTAVGRCTVRTSGARWRRWARASSRSTARANRR